MCQLIAQVYRQQQILLLSFYLNCTKPMLMQLSKLCIFLIMLFYPSFFLFLCPLIDCPDCTVISIQQNSYLVISQAKCIFQVSSNIFKNAYVPVFQDWNRNLVRRNFFNCKLLFQLFLCVSVSDSQWYLISVCQLGNLLEC